MTNPITLNDKELSQAVEFVTRTLRGATSVGRGTLRDLAAIAIAKVPGARVNNATLDAIADMVADVLVCDRGVIVRGS